MDELKYRILSLINKQSTKIPSMGFSDENYHLPQVNLSINSKTVSESDRPADQDILESIEAAYFSMQPDFDICRFELGKLPEILDCGQIQQDFKNLKQQHQVVSKKVLQLILEHQNGCKDEFEKVLEILDVVKDALEQCKDSRRNLSVAGNQFKACLSILANYRKRKLAQNLLNNLKMIKHLHNFEQRLQQLLSEEDYAGAIIELKKCQKMATNYRHFSCVAALTYKLQETLENTDSQLDKVLAKTCLHFDSERYKKLLHAYNLLEKSEISMIDNLHVHYITAIYNTSFNVVHSYVNSNEILESSDNSGKNPYKTLCQNVPHDVFIPCLVQLCKVLFKIVLSYHQLIKWHNNEESSSLDIETNINKQKLDHNLTKIWDDVQRKVSSLLLNADLASYKFDQFVQVLSVVHRLIKVGEEFCASKSEDLQESIRKQSINYFKNYHSLRLEELKIFLENEMWEICPVKNSFSILQLLEFKSLRSILKSFKQRGQINYSVIVNSSVNTNDCCSSNHSQDGSSIVGNYFIRYAEHGTPFDLNLNESVIEEDFLNVENDPSGYYSDDSDEESEELKKDYVDEYADEQQNLKETVKHANKGLILTNTALTVLRQIGKYLQMSRLLNPIAFQIISCMNQLFDFYLYSVHSFFTSDLTVSSNSLYSHELSATLRKISDNLITEFEDNLAENPEKIMKPTLSPMIDLKQPEKLHGLAERIVAVESVVFLSKQYEFLQEFLEFLVPQNNKIMLQQFFTQVMPHDDDVKLRVLSFVGLLPPSSSLLVVVGLSLTDDSLLTESIVNFKSKFHLAMDFATNKETKLELEDQFILRLPLQHAEYVRNLLHTKPKKIKKRLKIDLNAESRQAAVYVNNKVLEGRLRKLPTIVESLKTHNRSVCVKTADICEILDCSENNSKGSIEMIHGITPPLKNVKKKRFRKSLINRDETAVNVQKELFYLLQTDLEAVSTRFELIYSDNNGYNKSCNQPSSVNNNNNNTEKCEIELFGNVLTDSEETDSNIEDVEQ